MSKGTNIDLGNTPKLVIGWFGWLAILCSCVALAMGDKMAFLVLPVFGVLYYVIASFKIRFAKKVGSTIWEKVEPHFDEIVAYAKKELLEEEED